MRRRTWTVGVVLVAILVVPLIGWSTEFWLETPEDGDTVFGIVEVNGWIVDDRGVSKMELFVDGSFQTVVDLNVARWDIWHAFPWYQGLPTPPAYGFATSIDARSLSPGYHTMFLRVTFGDSSQEDFGQISFKVESDVNQVPFGELERPGADQVIQGVFPMIGWALDDSEVVRVEVLVDGQSYGEAVMGQERDDIANRFPAIPEAKYAGFIFNLNTANLENGLHTLAVRIWDNEGLSRVVGERLVQVSNTWETLVPFGEIEWPQPDHVMYAIGCTPQGGWSGEPYEDPRTVEIITGWVLDPDDGVKWVELLINGTVVATTRTNCWYMDWYETEVDCYGASGQIREDIFRLYSDVPNAKHSQFTFVIDVSDLIVNHGYHQGLHYLTVRAGDVSGHQVNIDTIPVIFDCNDDPDRPGWGEIYTPEKEQRVSGVIEVTGWAVDYDHIITDGVEIWVDGQFMGWADYPLESYELLDRFPWLSYGFAVNAGFRFELDTTQLSDGEHELVAISHDFWDGRTTLAQIPFVVDNLHLDSGSQRGVANSN